MVSGQVISIELPQKRDALAGRERDGSNLAHGRAGQNSHSQANGKHTTRLGCVLGPEAEPQAFGAGWAPEHPESGRQGRTYDGRVYRCTMRQ
jgi:hypothetical protein